MTDSDYYARERITGIHDRLAEIERRLDAVTSMLDLPFELFSAKRDGLPPDVIEAADRGDMMEAIKRLRAHTGMGLNEAKAAIEQAR